MSVNVIENFVKPELVQKIAESCKDKLVKSIERVGYFETQSRDLGPEVLSLVALSKMEVEKHYNVIVNDYHVGIVKMAEGAQNGLHSDMYNLDGTDWEDGHEREFSALIYLSDHGTDFSGGEIYFPNENLEIKPRLGTLVFFRGDLDHLHKVKKVLAGERLTLVMFFGKQ